MGQSPAEFYQLLTVIETCPAGQYEEITVLAFQFTFLRGSNHTRYDTYRAFFVKVRIPVSNPVRTYKELSI
jgi:hypothetical protein